MRISREWRLASFVIAFAAVDAFSVAVSDHAHRWPTAVLAGLSVVALGAARLAPLPAVLSAFLLLGLANALSPSLTGVQFFVMVLTFLVAGYTTRGAERLVAAAAGLALVAYGTFGIRTGGGWPDFALTAAICEGLLLVGAVAGKRSRQVHRMRAEAALVDERERWRTQEALRQERGRIARELHDVVSHGLSVVVVQAQAARAEAGAAAGEALLHHLDAVESTAREALAEMRRMLGLLQLDDLDPPGEEPEPPSPGLADLPELCDRARQAGLPITAQLPGEGARLPAGVELAVYRIVQEGLTNVVRHARGAPTAVHVTVSDSQVEITIHNQATTPAAEEVPLLSGGQGLVGMRERVLMYGGHLDVGPAADGGFTVSAVIPVTTDQLLGASR